MLGQAEARFGPVSCKDLSTRVSVCCFPGYIGRASLELAFIGDAGVSSGSVTHGTTMPGATTLTATLASPVRNCEFGELCLMLSAVSPGAMVCCQQLQPLGT